MRHLLVVLLIVCAPPPDVRAQTHHAVHPSASSSSGLSEEEEKGLLEGQGMGMARAAERNSYPGPLHVLQLADSLGLSETQRAEAERLYAAMKGEAQPLGAQIVEMERRLDDLFSSGQATSESVKRMTTHIGEVRGALRAVHLRAHLAMRDALTPAQRARYADLRTRPTPEAVPADQARAVATAFRTALAAGDRSAVEALLLPEARILESGNVETRDEYFAHHYASDVAFSQAMAHEEVSQTVEVSGDAAWVMTTSHLHGTYRDRDRAFDSAELLVLRRHEGAWRIAAVHWSSRSRD